MNHFGERLRKYRTSKKMSQSELARMIGTNHSLIGKYERGAVIPKIDAVIRIAEVLNITVGYLLGETTLQNDTMLNRLNDINSFGEKDRDCILYALDAMIRDVKTQQAYSS